MSVSINENIKLTDCILNTLQLRGWIERKKWASSSLFPDFTTQNSCQLKRDIFISWGGDELSVEVKLKQSFTLSPIVPTEEIEVFI